MVIKDEFSKPLKGKKLTPVDKELVAANPYDRLAAAIIDGIIILLPFVTLIVAPFKYNLATGYLYKNYEQVISSAFKISLMCLFVVITYFTLFHCLIGQTLGKRFFGLRVVNMWTNLKPNLYQSFVRTLVWVVCVALSGVPFLSLFSDRLRRAIHDKASDTVVLGEKAVTYPNPVERTFVRGIFASLLVLIIFVGFAAMDTVGSYILKSGVFSEGDGSYSEICKVVEDAKTKARVKSSAVGNKEVALSLFAAGALNRECLERELYFGGSEDPSEALDLLINSFIYSDVAELSNKYLDTVCANFPLSVECDVTKVINLWSESDGNLVDLNRLAVLVSDRYPDYIKVWAFKYLAQEQYFIASDRLWESIEGKSYLSPFLLSLQIQSAFGNKQNKLAWALYDREAVARLSDDEVGPWLCLQSALQNCQSLTLKSCERLQARMKKAPWVVSTSSTRSLAFAEMSRCQGESIVGIKGYLSRSVSDLYEAVEYADDSKTSLNEVLSWLRRSQKINPTAETVLLSHLLEVKRIKTMEKDLFARWVKSEDNFHKNMQGYAWVKHWKAKKDFKSLLLVTSKMSKSFNDPYIYKAQLLAGQKLNKQRVIASARAHLDDLESAKILRLPASKDQGKK